MSHIILNPIQPQNPQVAQISNCTWILLRQRESDVHLSSRYHLEGKIWNYYVCVLHSPHFSAFANITLFSWHGYSQFAFFVLLRHYLMISSKAHVFFWSCRALHQLKPAWHIVHQHSRVWVVSRLHLSAIHHLYFSEECRIRCVTSNVIMLNQDLGCGRSIRVPNKQRILRWSWIVLVGHPHSWHWSITSWRRRYQSSANPIFRFLRWDTSTLVSPYPNPMIRLHFCLKSISSQMPQLAGGLSNISTTIPQNLGHSPIRIKQYALNFCRLRNMFNFGRQMGWYLFRISKACLFSSALIACTF